MHEVQKNVREFHEALAIDIGLSPAIRRPELRASLIAEETRETLEAITGREWNVVDREEPSERTPDGSLIEAIDGMCDILCVVYGTAVEFGVDLGPFWREIHRTNMAKKGGPVRADGKRLKPEGWTPPDLAPILAAQEQPEWAQTYSYLCLNCGEVSRADSWERLSYDEESGDLGPAPADDEARVERCPSCGFDHEDTDSGPGLYSGSRYEMEAERKRLLSEWGDSWIEAWREKAQKPEEVPA